MKKQNKQQQKKKYTFDISLLNEIDKVEDKFEFKLKSKKNQHEVSKKIKLLKKEQKKEKKEIKDIMDAEDINNEEEEVGVYFNGICIKENKEKLKNENFDGIELYGWVSEEEEEKIFFNFRIGKK